MTEKEQQTLAAIAVVGLAAAYLLLREDEIKPGAGFPEGVPGTGRAPAPGGSPAEPGPAPGERPASTVLERVGSVINDWFDTLTGQGADKAAPKPADYRSPAQWRTELRPLFRRLETSFAMPRGLLEAVADRESGFRHDIITGETVSSAGAEGIMQLMPQYHLTRPERLNPQVAIPYGARYLAKQFLKFGTWEDALAAYNWGPGNLSTKGLINAPRETKEYVAWIKSRSYVDGFV